MSSRSSKPRQLFNALANHGHGRIRKKDMYNITKIIFGPSLSDSDAKLLVQDMMGRDDAIEYSKFKEFLLDFVLVDNGPTNFYLRLNENDANLPTFDGWREIMCNQGTPDNIKDILSILSYADADEKLDVLREVVKQYCRNELKTEQESRFMKPLNLLGVTKEAVGDSTTVGNVVVEKMNNPMVEEKTKTKSKRSLKTLFNGFIKSPVPPPDKGDKPQETSKKEKEKKKKTPMLGDTELNMESHEPSPPISEAKMKTLPRKLRKPSKEKLTKTKPENVPEYQTKGSTMLKKAKLPKVISKHRMNRKSKTLPLKSASSASVSMTTKKPSKRKPASEHEEETDSDSDDTTNNESDRNKIEPPKEKPNRHKAQRKIKQGKTVSEVESPSNESQPSKSEETSEGSYSSRNSKRVVRCKSSKNLFKNVTCASCDIPYQVIKHCPGCDDIVFWCRPCSKCDRFMDCTLDKNVKANYRLPSWGKYSASICEKCRHDPTTSEDESP